MCIRDRYRSQCVAQASQEQDHVSVGRPTVYKTLLCSSKNHCIRGNHKFGVSLLFTYGRIVSIIVMACSHRRQHSFVSSRPSFQFATSRLFKTGFALSVSAVWTIHRARTSTTDCAIHRSRCAVNGSRVAQASIDGVTIDRLRSTIYGSIDIAKSTSQLWANAKA